MSCASPSAAADASSTASVPSEETKEPVAASTSAYETQFLSGPEEAKEALKEVGVKMLLPHEFKLPGGPLTLAHFAMLGEGEAHRFTHSGFNMMTSEKQLGKDVCAFFPAILCPIELLSLIPIFEGAPVIGLFRCNDRVFSLTKHTTKQALQSWAKPAEECCMCFEGVSDKPETVAKKKLRSHVNCAHCGVQICCKCVLRLTFDNGYDFRKAPRVHNFLCPCCRFSDGCIDVAESCVSVVKYGLVDDEFDAKTKGVIKRKVKGSDEYKKRDQLKRCCHGCGRHFWDRKARRRALKCKQCKSAVYCSVKCRKDSFKTHESDCHIWRL